MRILIVGAGIAGPTLAYWLHRFGNEPVLVEVSPHLREGGYLVDFWGAGFEVAHRMGLTPRLRDEGYRIREVREVSRTGRRIAHFNPLPVLDRIGDRYVSIRRSDLAKAIFESSEGEVETIFGDTVQALQDTGDRVEVSFGSGAQRTFDLVIGADGLHSRVRALRFGPERDVERDLGIAVSVFDVPGYAPRDELVAVTHTEVGTQALRVALRDGATMFCFMFRQEGALPAGREGQESLLRRRLGRMGWEVPSILAQMPQARTFYLDRASQILIPSWSRGRIALVGDAAAAPSLLAGQGTALAMVEAYTLATAIDAAPGNHRMAFETWERGLKPLVRAKQDAAVGMASAFAPRNRAQLLLRDGVVGLMGIPGVANAVMGRSLRDPIRLPPLPSG
ncbi:MAG: FAD-binding domain [Actinobacteria bacterium]|nr:FAD-binding domain [Actinomycetota bacterium]